MITTTWHKSQQRLIYVKAEPPVSPWHLIPSTEIVKAIHSGAMFATWTQFEFEPNGAGPEPLRFGNMPLDFDCKENPGKALDDMKRLCLVHLPELFDVDPYTIRPYGSGSKGFHAVLPAYLFGSQAGHQKLPLIYKRIATEFRDELGLETLDMSMYAMGKGKMFRLANVRRDNGAYKVPLALEEVMTFSVERLFELTKAPRRIDPVDVDQVPCLATLYELAKARVDDEVITPSEPMSKEELARLKEDTPSCIETIISTLPPTTDKFNFNRGAMLLCNFFQDTGFEFETAVTHCENFFKNYPHSQSYNTEQKRLAEFKKVWTHMVRDFGYFFSCERAKALGLHYDCLRCAKGAVEFEFAIEPNPTPPESPAVDMMGFPEGVMRGPAGDFSRLFAEVLEVPAHFLFCSYLTCLGAMFAHNLSVDSELRTQARLYTLLIGESATERKSTALSKVAGVFKNVFAEFKVRWGLGSAEGLQQIFKKKPNSPFVDDRHGVLLAFDEFKSFVSKCQISTSVLLPVVNTLFEQNNYETHTKNTSIVLRDVNISLLAATTKDTYDRLYDGNFLDIGFPNRVFIVPGHAGKRFSIPEKLSSENYTKIHADLLGIKHFVGRGVEFGFTPGAKATYHNWYMNLEASIHAKRLDTYSLRLMQLLALNARENTIDEQIIQDAIDLANWQLDVRRQYDPISADTKGAEVEQRILRQLQKSPQSERDLKRGINAGRIGLWFYSNAMAALKKEGEIAYDTKSKLWRRT